MSKQDVVHFKDWKHVGVEPDVDFNADHNKDVIEKTIKGAERMKRQKRREHQEGLAERSEAISKYLTSVDQGGAETDVTKYFGRKYKGGLTSIDATGKIIRQPGDII